MDRALGLLTFFVVLLVVGFEVYLHIRHWFQEDEPGSSARRDYSLLGDALREEERVVGSRKGGPADSSATNESRRQ